MKKGEIFLLIIIFITVLAGIISAIPAMASSNNIVRQTALVDVDYYNATILNDTTDKLEEFQSKSVDIWAVIILLAGAGIIVSILYACARYWKVL